MDKYPYTKQIHTRWSDNDQYGHLNNAVYYQFYDALVNAYMMQYCNWDPNTSESVGLVVSSSTEYYKIVEGFPEPITFGLGINKLGNSSAEWEIGVFQGDLTKPKAIGRFVHVFVDKKTDKTMPGGMPNYLRSGLEQLLIRKDINNDNKSRKKNSSTSKL